MAGYIKAGVLGGIVLFIWGMLSWMVLPWHSMTMHSFANEQLMTETVRASAPQPGAYFMPSMAKPNAAAPVKMFAVVEMQSEPTTMAMPMIIGLITQIIAAFLVAWLLSKTTGLGYWKRVMFVMVFALGAGVVTHVPYWNWMGFSKDFTLVAMADLIVGWFLAGLVLAKFYRK